ncbi:type VI secretion system Vgr family protein [Candidatus Thiomargarita nelsonii]|uniref:Type VI secretion system Vgr family protein n=1 Tax=Candidatus Thiomargarita nelsonii TaxID=1003181 RepID=A0A176RVU3_9GAMM|nr:type VI secretion system Vgr family protein [Candidatus Thiomargarita nelsonii]
MPGDEYRFVLQNEPPKREYCVQYRESEFDFISRLLEEEGIFYFFEHHDNKHILVMGDSPSAHKAIQGESQIIFHEPRPGQVADEPHIYSFNYTEEILSGKVSLKDYNFKKPALNLKGEKTGDKNTELEVYDYPGKFDEPGRGNNLAKVRLEEYQTVKKEGSGATTCTHFAAGFFFTMEEYPRDDFNKKYLITQHQISGSQPQVLEETAGESGSSFSSSFECIPFEVPYRPDRVTPKPVVEGSQTAIVVGPKGEEIYTNEHGQVKVQFHWDREGKMDEKSSCWIRVSQLWAGRRWGAMYIPRIDQEVIVDFLEGDPDRPIITGRVYHGTNKPPYPLPAEKTKSTIKSDSSKGGGGFNEIRFEDKKGKEEVYIQAEKDRNELVKNDMSTNVKHDQSLTVHHDRTKTIKHNETITIDGTSTKTIDKTTSITIKTGTYSHDVADNTATYHVKKALTENYDDTQTTTVNKKIKIESKADIEITAATQIKLKTGESTLLMKSDGTIEIKGLNIKIEGIAIAIEGGVTVAIHGGMVTSKADTVHNTSGALVESKGTATNTVKGGVVLLNP